MDIYNESNGYLQFTTYSIYTVFKKVHSKLSDKINPSKVTVYVFLRIYSVSAFLELFIFHHYYCCYWQQGVRLLISDYLGFLDSVLYSLHNIILCYSGGSAFNFTSPRIALEVVSI